MDQIQVLEELVSSGELDKALNVLEKLSQEERNCWQIQNLTGAICAYCGQFKEAETFFCAALEQQPNDSNIMYNLADTYAALGKKEKAEELLHRCESGDRGNELREDIAALRKKMGMQNKRRVLMAAYYFPPLSGSGVFRSLKFAKYLHQDGWIPTVISAEKPPLDWQFGDQSLMEEIPDDVEVIRLPDCVRTEELTSMETERVQAILDMLHGVLCHSGETDELFRQMLQTKEGTVEMLLFPCAALSWAYDAIQYIEKNVNLNEFHVIYTTSGPNSAHLIGFYLKQKYGIPWVADYRDPWTFNPYAAGYDPLNPRQKLLFELESVLLRHADCNLTIETGFIEDYVKHFGLDQDKIKSITNGYDEADFTMCPAKSNVKSHFVINYSGILYTQQRNIEPILKAVYQLKCEGKIDITKVKLRIVGVSDQSNFDAVVKYELEGIIQYAGYVSHREAIQSNMDANLLLLLVGDDSKFKAVYTGKLFEYLRSGRPILALAPKNGAVDRLLRESGHGEAFLSTQIPKIKAMILREYRRWEKGEGTELLHSPVIEKFERKVLTEQLAQVLADAVENSSSLPISGSVGTVANGPKYLVICNGGYPTEGNPRCMFAHKRVLQYIKAGLNVEAFGFIWGASLQRYQYEGVKVTQGGTAELQALLETEHYEKLLIHFADAGIMYAIQQAGKIAMPMVIWGHGYEISRWHRTYYCYSNAEIKSNRKRLEETDQEKINLFKQLFQLDNICFVFISKWMANRAWKTIGTRPLHYEVVPNFIDCGFYQMSAKKVEDRARILCIKSHATKTYAGDLTAKAIIELSHREIFSKLSFELCGDGALFQDDFGELIKCKFPNVTIKKKFLSQQEMKEAFARNGILMSPTRFDTQGVTACEAMSAGLAVISCNTAAIPEFIDEDCGSLYEFDNYFQLADEIEYLYYHPEEFLRKSRNAVERVRKQCGYDATIKRELQLITEN